MSTSKSIFSGSAVKTVLVSVIFAVTFVLSIVLPMNSNRLDSTAMVELSFVLAFGATVGLSELFGIITGFGRAKYAALSVSLCAVMTVIRTFEQWFTFIGLNEVNSRDTFNAYLKSNILLHFVILVTAIAFGFIIHRNKKGIPAAQGEE